MSSSSSRKTTALTVLLGTLATVTQAHTTLLVVDPGGNAVPSDIVQLKPGPQKNLGQTDQTGKFPLPNGCKDGSLFRADPRAQDYWASAKDCDARSATVRIEVTPIAVIIRLKANMDSAVKAGNQAAVAQIAEELSGRARYHDEKEALHFANIATVALSRVYSLPSNSPVSSKVEDGLVWTAYQPDAPQAVWTSICHKSDLVSCKQDDVTQEVRVNPSKKLGELLKKDPKAPAVPDTDKLGSEIIKQDDWLKGYSGKGVKIYVDKSLDKGALVGWKSPDDHTG